MDMRKLLWYATVVLLVLFGSLTLFLSSSIIFDWFDIRIREGNYVVFIVWANFCCSLIYLVSAFGLWKGKAWVVRLLALALGILLVALAALAVHINGGGLYETKTIGAMILRITVTAGLALGSYYVIRKETVSAGKGEAP